MSRQEYIGKYKDLAIRQMKAYGIPASIIMAQACLESGDGNSSLAVNANNHFGIKCHDWKGESVRHDDDEKNECFRKYKHAEESFSDHSDFLRYRQRYSFLFDLDSKDYKGWAYGLKQAGYATNPQYPELLIKIIEDYQLYLFDREVTVASLPPTPESLKKPLPLNPLKKSPLYKFSINRSLFTQNGTAFIVAEQHDTYESIAKEYNLFTKELKRFNDADKNQELKAGDMVYVQKKRNKSPKHLDMHIVDNGDTLRNIAQQYGVQLKHILKYNNLKETDIIHPGDKIKLRK